MDELELAKALWCRRSGDLLLIQFGDGTFKTYRLLPPQPNVRRSWLHPASWRRARHPIP